jgi:hypothetical protein
LFTARQSSGTCRLPEIGRVPSCAIFAVIYLALVMFRNHTAEIEAPMAMHKLSILVGISRRESINRKLAQALAKLGGDAFEAKFIQIDDLLSFPKIPSGLDSHRRAESSHH